jgi:hypothetical protein
VAFSHRAKSEKPDSEKKSHTEVSYIQPSPHKTQFCADCEHFIFGSPPRCQGVKSPIHWDGWCVRFEER